MLGRLQPVYGKLDFHNPDNREKKLLAICEVNYNLEIESYVDFAKD